jgi:hypothetical protein
MKILFKSLFILLLVAFTFQSCQDEDDLATPMNIEVQNFVWKGLNLYYLWQADVPNLADTKFKNQAELNTFLSGYPKPENLFDALRVDKSIDKFSWMVDDYLELEGALQGTTNNNGVEFGLSYKSSGSNEIIGWVRYIIPNSDASTKNIKRGDIFYAVNGTQLTDANYNALLFGSNNDYTLNMADINGGAITPNGKTVALTKTVLDENPILVNTVITSGSKKIGYLLYNGFYSNYDTKLNEAFGTLKSQGITDLVLDLRYNGGGSVTTATRLASMITGSFTRQVFSKQQWNAKIESYYLTNNPESLKDFFVDKIGTIPINSLNMTKIYILTSRSSASASELRNPNHRYAMQPIVLKIVNSVGFGDYQSGLTPTFSLKESLSNLGVLGTSTEPLLNLAIAKITGIGKTKQPTEFVEFKFFKDTKSATGRNQMHLEKAPEGLLKALE